MLYVEWDRSTEGRVTGSIRIVNIKFTEEVILNNQRFEDTKEFKLFGKMSVSRL